MARLSGADGRAGRVRAGWRGGGGGRNQLHEGALAAAGEGVPLPPKRRAVHVHRPRRRRRAAGPDLGLRAPKAGERCVLGRVGVRKRGRDTATARVRALTLCARARV